MQHMNGVLELGHVEDAIFTLRVDSNLNDSSADKWNRLPIDGRTSCLNQAQLIADFATRCLREPPQAVTTVSEPFDQFCVIPHALRLYRIFIIGMECDLLLCLAPKWRSVTTGGTGRDSALNGNNALSKNICSLPRNPPTYRLRKLNPPSTFRIWPVE